MQRMKRLQIRQFLRTPLVLPDVRTRTKPGMVHAGHDHPRNILGMCLAQITKNEENKKVSRIIFLGKHLVRTRIFPGYFWDDRGKYTTVCPENDLGSVRGYFSYFKMEELMPWAILSMLFHFEILISIRTPKLPFSFSTQGQSVASVQGRAIVGVTLNNSFLL